MTVATRLIVILLATVVGLTLLGVWISGASSNPTVRVLTNYGNVKRKQLGEPSYRPGQPHRPIMEVVLSVAPTAPYGPLPSQMIDELKGRGWRFDSDAPGILNGANKVTAESLNANRMQDGTWEVVYDYEPTLVDMYLTGLRRQ
jgi:hypothetical protein